MIFKDWHKNKNVCDYQVLNTENKEVYIHNNVNTIDLSKTYLTISATSDYDKHWGELERYEVKELIDRLTAWLETGSLEIKEMK